MAPVGRDQPAPVPRLRPGSTRNSFAIAALPSWSQSATSNSARARRSLRPQIAALDRSRGPAEVGFLGLAASVAGRPRGARCRARLRPQRRCSGAAYSDRAAVLSRKGLGLASVDLGAALRAVYFVPYSIVSQEIYQTQAPHLPHLDKNHRF